MRPLQTMHQCTWRRPRLQTVHQCTRRRPRSTPRESHSTAECGAARRSAPCAGRPGTPRAPEGREGSGPAARVRGAGGEREARACSRSLQVKRQHEAPSLCGLTFMPMRPMLRTMSLWEMFCKRGNQDRQEAVGCTGALGARSSPCACCRPCTHLVQNLVQDRGVAVSQ